MRDNIIKRGLGECGADADSPAIAAATVRALNRMLGQLKPLVGELAWRALYVRSLYLARSSFAKPGADATLPEDLLAPLQRDLSTRLPAEARRAAEALLLALADLLVSLIGEPLTGRLLHKAWDMPAAEKSSQEKPQ